MPEQGHGGLAVAHTLKELGVGHLFTLSGGHIFPIFDGCKQLDIAIVDVRHEQTAAFAAEGMARLTRNIGVAAVTAGPGVTNAMSAIAQARFNQAPVLLLGGRAPQFRWGQGSLQEIDHVPFVDPLAPSETVHDLAAIPKALVSAAHAALTPPRGPRFLDFPLDVLFNMGEFEVEVPRFSFDSVVGAEIRESDGPPTIGELIEASERPIIVAGSNVWLDHAENELRRLVETARIPCFMNGQGRGCIPADHELAFARSRSKAMKEADLVIVAGAPFDFRLGFGQSFATGTKVVHIDHHVAEHVALAVREDGYIQPILKNIADNIERPPDTKAWVEALRTLEVDKSEQVKAELQLDTKPIHPMRVYGELVPRLDRDAIVIGDGGDFVSYAGREVPSYEPGCWLDPGPFGCLGVGPGYAMAARLAHPDRQIVLLYGDGAIGFAGFDLESIVRHKLPVVCVVGNNGIWGLEKHPMQGLYGYDVAADLQPGLRYDQVMEAFGGKGETVSDPSELGAAFDRALSSGEPYLVNVLTDPDIAYPRSANLA